MTYIGPIIAALGLIAFAWKESLPRRDGKAFTAAVILILFALAAWFLPGLATVSPARVIVQFMEGLFPLPSNTPAP